MRISDWSSDVCSSDLQIFGLGEFVADLASQLTAVQTAMLFEGEQDLLGVGTHRGLGFKSRRRHVPASRCGRPYGAAARTMWTAHAPMLRRGWSTEIGRAHV